MNTEIANRGTDVIIRKTNYCQHNDNKYSLSIDIENAHIDFSTYNYAPLSGHCNHISIYGLTPELMIELATNILETANKIRGAK